MAENNEGAAATRELAVRVGELTQAVTSGFNNIVNALSQCAAAQLPSLSRTATAMESMASDVALIEGHLVKDADASATMSHATNPHGQTLNLGTSSGIKGWRSGVTLPESISTDIVVGPEAQEEFKALLECIKVNGLGRILLVPKAGAGTPGTSCKPSLPGLADPVPDTNLDQMTDMASNKAGLDRDDILAFAGWIHGDVDTGRVIPTTRVQKVLDFNAANANKKAVARLKHQYRIQADMLMQIWRTHINSTSLKAFLAQKEIYVWKKESDGTEFYCGLTVLWLILETVEPTTVVDRMQFEAIITQTSLVEHCGGDLRLYISKLKEARNELIVRHGSDRMSDNTFLQHLFDGVRVVKQPNFSTLVTTLQSQWLQGISTDVEATLNAMDKLYISLLSGKNWHIEEPEDPKLVALATENTKLQKKVEKLQQDTKKSSQSEGGGSANGPFKNAQGVEVAGPKGSHGYSIDLWRTIKKGNSTTRNGKKYFWCKKHWHGKGLYMIANASDPERHDHAAWKEGLKEKRAKSDKKRKAGGDVSSVSSSASAAAKQPKLKVRRGDKAINALVTQYGMDHGRALEFMAKHGTQGSGHESDDSDDSGN